MLFLLWQFLLKVPIDTVNTHGSDKCCGIQVVDSVVLEQVWKRWKLLVADTET